MTGWLYKGVEIDQEFFGTDHKSTPYYGFVYVITNLTNGRKYVGKKVLWSKRTLPPLKGKKRKRVVFKPSDWMKYWSSCKPLLADIKQAGQENFTREIVELYPDKREANFAELRYQIIHNVLDEVDDDGVKIWYNENIERIYYPTKVHGERRKQELKAMINQLAD